MTGTLQLLLLEDNLEEAKQLKTLLQKHAYQVTVAHNKDEAQLKIKENNFDIIVLVIMINEQPEEIA